MPILSLRFSVHTWFWAVQLSLFVLSILHYFPTEAQMNSFPTEVYTDYFPTETYTAANEIQTHTITVGKVRLLLVSIPDQRARY